jgi:hypothetical protein
MVLPLDGKVPCFHTTCLNALAAPYTSCHIQEFAPSKIHPHGTSFHALSAIAAFILLEDHFKGRYVIKKSIPCAERTKIPAKPSTAYQNAHHDQQYAREHVES